MKSITEYDSLNQDLLQQLIAARFLHPWTSKEVDRKPSLELIITPQCNLGCEYCYFQRYGDRLYPENIRNPAQIIENLKCVLHTFDDYEYVDISHISLFAGEIWDSPLGYEVLDVLYTYLSTHKLTSMVFIPTNCTFLLNPENRMYEYLNKFRRIGVKLYIAASIDGGRIEDEVRPFKHVDLLGCRDEEFYRKVLGLVTECDGGFRPVLSAGSIEKAIDNYKWWIDYLKDSNYPIETILNLEVRNNDWTPDKLIHYKEFLAFVLDFVFTEVMQSDVTKMADFVFGVGDQPEHLDKRKTILRFSPLAARARCSIQESLFIRLGDLSICPCHRLSYEEYNYGRLIAEHGKVAGIEAGNVHFAVKTLLSNPEYYNIGCDACAYRSICGLGCHGAQFEENQDANVIIDSVCHMHRTKFNYLLDRYTEMGLVDNLINRKNLSRPDEKKREGILSVIRQINLSRRRSDDK